VLKILVRIVGVLLVVLLVAFLLARRADGPIAIIAGGPFTTGDLYVGPEPNWEFLRDQREVQFQLLDPPRSRTTWVVEHEGRAYIPSGYMKTPVGRIWKQWPHEALEDGRALLRVDGQIYEIQLVRLKEGPAVLPVLQKVSRKYIGGEAPTSTDAVRDDEIWLFELAPRD
jgi:hypothetical protein